MQIVKLNNGKEFKVESVLQSGDITEIYFQSGVTYSEIASAYDPLFDEEVYSIDALRRFEIISEDGEVEGVHFGYTNTQNISYYMDRGNVTIAKENELTTDVKMLKSDLPLIVETIETINKEFPVITEEIEVIKSELPNIAEEINAVGEQADFISEDSMFLAEAVFQMDERLILTEEQVSIISELQERLISLEEQLNALNIQPLPIGGK